MKRCKMEVRATHDGTIILWCNTCSETVGFNNEHRDRLTEGEVRETSKGHHKVMQRAHEIRREHERRAV